ncbi:MAG: riboflavin synthase subunit alpha [Pseudomonadota bacterium]
MFTGIVQDLVTVQRIEHHGDISRLSLDLGGMTDGLQTGASVAVNGVCLTVTHVGQGSADFDIVAETLRMTNLGRLQAQDQVNVERSFAVGAEVGGHIVSGHVSGTAELVERRVQGHDHVVVLATPADWFKYIFLKGFVALDGASLTVSDVWREEGRFAISLIPETLQRTTLGFVDEGSFINVEVDSQTVTTVDTVERLMADPQWREQIGLAS